MTSFSSEFNTRYSTHRRNRSFKGSAHLQIVQALKDHIKYQEMGMPNAELILTTSQEPNFKKLQETIAEEIKTARNYPQAINLLSPKGANPGPPNHFKTPKNRVYPGAQLFQTIGPRSTKATTVKQ